MSESLVLRDIHQPSAPPWWPPAPGWWLLATVLLALLAIPAWRRWRRARRRRAHAALFDRTLESTTSPAAQVAAMSELLRRAARQRTPHADTLVGEDWLRFLDAAQSPPVFASSAGRLLVEGGYRRDVDPDDVARLRPLARARFLAWMDA